MKKLHLLPLLLLAMPRVYFGQTNGITGGPAPIIGDPITGPISGATQVLLTASSPAAGVNQQVTITSNVPVAFSLTAGSGTLTTVNSERAVYTAPASVPIASPIGGCGSFPNDSVFNTPITNLPLNANSALWLSRLQTARFYIEPSFSYNLITSPDYPTLAMKYFYGGSNPAVPLLSWPNKKRESGWDAASGDHFDHHSLTVTTGQNPCHFYEMYNDVISPSTTFQCQNGTSGCNAASGDDYTNTSYGQIAGTDAANLPQYLTLRLDEIKNNAIHHPSRFTLAQGYIQASATGTPFLWPATGQNGWGPASAVPYGARLRLRSSFDVSGYSQYAQNILNSFKQYGIMLADIGTTGAITTGTDVWEDPAVEAALWEAIGNLTFANFDVVDESSLMLTANSLQVNPTNAYVVPSGTARVTARELYPSVGQNPFGYIDVGLVGVGVGLRNPQVSALATGANYTYDFGNDAWVTGTSNQNLTWTLASGPGSVTAYGLYTFPASVSQVTAAALTATSAADPNAKATQYILIYPVGTDGNFRTTVAGQYTDGLGFNWWHMAGMEGGVIIQNPGDYPPWSSLLGNPEQVIYQSSAYGQNSDLHWRFIVPNGNYRVRFLLGQQLNGCFVNCTLLASTHQPLSIGVNGQLDAHWYLWGSQVNNQAGVPWDYLAPAAVSNNILDAWIGRVNPEGSSNQSYPQVSGVELVPDNSAPHISIDTGMEGWAAGTTKATTQALAVQPGSTQQLYAVGWYMPNTVTWSISGPGSINSTTGLYTAASVTPPAPQYVTVTAKSTVNSSLTATATLVIP